MTTKAPAQANATTTNLRTISFIVRSDDGVNTAQLKTSSCRQNQKEIGGKPTAGSYRPKRLIDATRETVLVYFD
jgi:hypothetical protein